MNHLGPPSDALDGIISRNQLRTVLEATASPELSEPPYQANKGLGLRLIRDGTRKCKNAERTSSETSAL